MNGPRLTHAELDAILRDSPHLGPTASGAERLRQEILTLWAERDEMRAKLAVLGLRMAVTRRLQAMEGEQE